MKEIVINACYGGFGISPEFESLFENRHDIKEDDPKLIALIKEHGSDRVSGAYAKLKIITVTKPHYLIVDYDGIQIVYQSDSPIEYVPLN